MEFNSINDVKDYYQKVGALASSCSTYYIERDAKPERYHLREKRFNNTDRYTLLSASSIDEIIGKLEAMAKAAQFAKSLDWEYPNESLVVEYFPKHPPL